MEILTMIVSSSPYGDRRIWNALRLAEALICSSARMRMNIFLIGEAVNAAKKVRNPLKASIT
jgi:sulfur relay (sulfurtransferase) complex TusBCD TusD component (DsrE family)